MASVAVPAAAAPAKNRDRFRFLTGAAGLTAPLALLLIVAVLAQQAWPAMTKFSWPFLVGREWDPVHIHFGALPYIYSTVVSSALALLVAVPVGIGVAIFLAEPGQAGVRGAIGIGVELLAAVPSVVYGLWALFVMGPWVFKNLETPISDRLGWIPIFAGPPRSAAMFTAGLILAVMILPTLASISRDVIRAVPGGLREASVALGATWWETTWRVILPAARAGIIGAVVLALGRALGETIAVTMTIGNRNQISASLFEPAYSLAAVIANEFTEATGPLHSAALVELGLVLIAVTLTVNLLALGLLRLSGLAARPA
ncbi:MAG: phosphate ABC transporter permease subunit PstC [Chloroflexi bacterium]|nr:MAG: phosphate ABC transporter permease subunit PstC [Chloroflexota bacterium]TMD51455.1 MAG: phosphate ABC transporter permease subunit PstC [Chloroflexota bacterium]